MEPHYSYLPELKFDWTHTVYGDVHEILPQDIPDPLGKTVTATTRVDANLNRCLATGRSLTGCIHFVNHNPIDSYSKRQATVETATYGSEFVASKTATKQISMLLQQKSGQLVNNLAEQQVNNNNKPKQKNKHKNNSLHHYPKF